MLSLATSAEEQLIRQATNRFVLVTTVLELDMSRFESFSPEHIVLGVRHAVSNINVGKAEEINVFLLDRKPGHLRDALTEDYDYCGTRIRLYQDGDSLGSANPTFFAVVGASVLKCDVRDYEGVRAAAQAKVDRRVLLAQRRALLKDAGLIEPKK